MPRRDGNSGSLSDRSKKGYVKGCVKGKFGEADNPLDLWIHHVQMEMSNGQVTASQFRQQQQRFLPIARRSQGRDSLDGVPSGSITGPLASSAHDSLDRRDGYVTA